MYWIVEARNSTQYCWSWGGYCSVTHKLHFVSVVKILTVVSHFTSTVVYKSVSISDVILITFIPVFPAK